MIVVMNITSGGVLSALASRREAIPIVLSQLRRGIGGPAPQEITRATSIVSFVGTTVYVNNIAFSALERILAGEFTEMKDFFAIFPVTPKVAEITGIAQAALGRTITCLNDSQMCRAIEAHVRRYPLLRRHDATRRTPQPLVEEAVGR